MFFCEWWAFGHSVGCNEACPVSFKEGTLAYRVAGILLLLYAQPLTKIAALQTTAVVSVDGDTRIMLGQEPIPLPQLFADMLHRHLATRPNLRTAGGVAVSPWLFPGVLPGRHLTAQSITTRLRSLGINLLGARNTALQSLAAEVPPPLVAELLGYSYNVVQRHADIAAQPWARYVTRTAATTVIASSADIGRTSECDGVSAE